MSSCWSCIFRSCLHDTALLRDIFYMKPRLSLPDSASDPWYMNIPMGHNALGTFLKNILQKGGIDTFNNSNHSLRAAAISRMCESNVPQKLISK